MQHWTYPARIERVETETELTYLLTLPDFPEAVTEGATPELAVAEAPDLLTTVVAGYLDRGMKIPSPRAAGVDEVDVTLDPAMAARAALSSIMARERITKVALADLMGRDEKTVRNLLRPKGASLDLVMRALQAVGAEPMLSI